LLFLVFDFFIVWFCLFICSFIYHLFCFSFIFFFSGTTCPVFEKRGDLWDVFFHIDKSTVRLNSIKLNKNMNISEVVSLSPSGDGPQVLVFDSDITPDGPPSVQKQMELSYESMDTKFFSEVMYGIESGRSEIWVRHMFQVWGEWVSE
jgi:hypothetical protein